MQKNHLTLSSKARLAAVGVRFKPTDAELILHYLCNKVRGNPLPSATAVIDFDVYGDCRRLFRLFHEREEDTLYFFTRLKLKTDNGSRVDRLTDLGTWRSQSDTPVDDQEEKLIGFKRSFNFKPKEGFEDIGRWVMYEYRLDAVPSGPHYVICKIIKKQPEGMGRRRRRSRSNTNETGSNNHNFMFFNVGGGLSGGAAGHQGGMECGNCGMEAQTGAVADFQGQFGYGHAAGYQGQYLQGQGHVLCVTGSGAGGNMVVQGAGLNAVEAQSNAVDGDFGSDWEFTDVNGMNVTNGAAGSNGEEIMQTYTATKPACADNGDEVIVKSETLEWNSAKDLDNIINS